MSSLEEELHKAIQLLENKVDKVGRDIQELKDSELVTAFVKRVDTPGREVLALILTDTGVKEVILRTWFDSITLDIFNQFIKGRSKFVFRIASGYISQVMDNDVLPEKIAELSEALAVTPQITSSLSEEDKVARNNIHPSDTAGMNGAISRILHDWEHAKRR